MFDRTIIQQGRTEYVPYEKTVIEKRAPTDDSIRIYEEVKEKAFKSIIDTIEVNDNSFNVKVITYDDQLSMSRVCKFVFTINGHEISGEVRDDRRLEYDKEAFIHKVIEESSNQLSIKLAEMILKNVR